MRRKLRWLLILVVLAAFAVWLEPTRVVWGWLRGEAFYDGRPTSFWRHRFLQWERVEVPIMQGIVSPPRPTHWRWNPTWVGEQLANERAFTIDFPRPFGNEVDLTVVPLLQELLDDPSPVVRDVAQVCLEQLTLPAVPP